MNSFIDKLFNRMFGCLQTFQTRRKTHVEKFPSSTRWGRRKRALPGIGRSELKHELTFSDLKSIHLNAHHQQVDGREVSCSIEKATLKDVVSGKTNFRFDWRSEIRKYDVYKLITKENPEIIQGLISISPREDFVFLPLIERAGFGKTQIKIYEGVAKLLISFACYLSLKNGSEGCVAFDAKTKLINYYGTMAGARRISNSNRMIILPDQAQKLVSLLYEE